MNNNYTNTKKNNNNNNKNKLRKKLLKKCNLPDVPETSHCFGDSTHHTCCLLGKNSREYADSSGNPIGSLSLKLQNGKTNKKNLTPWCTCSGSKVCSYYTKKFGKKDGTHIKFIGNLKKNKKTKYNENNAITKLNIFRHKTPGIYITN